MSEKYAQYAAVVDEKCLSCPQDIHILILEYILQMLWKISRGQDYLKFFRWALNAITCIYVREVEGDTPTALPPTPPPQTEKAAVWRWSRWRFEDVGLENWSDGTANEERSIGRQRELKQEREGLFPKPLQRTQQRQHWLQASGTDFKLLAFRLWNNTFLVF